MLQSLIGKIIGDEILWIDAEDISLLQSLIGKIIVEYFEICHNITHYLVFCQAYN